MILKNVPTSRKYRRPTPEPCKGESPTSKTAELDPVKLILNHFSNRPIGIHLLVWTFIGMVLGITLTPSFQLTSLIAFMISGVITCGILGLITYPVSQHHWLTFAGAMAGLLTAPLLLVMGVSVTTEIYPMTLIIGALIGGTCFIWMKPATWIIGKLKFN